MGRHSQGQVTVMLFVTGEPAAGALLWHHLLSPDLMTGVRVPDRPADDLLPWLLTGARHARPGDRSDFLWIRPLDVGTMLAADLTLDVATLGAIYPGGYGVRPPAAAGLLDEHSPGAVARADVLFRPPVTPWCGTWFRTAAGRAGRAGRDGPRRQVPK